MSTSLSSTLPPLHQLDDKVLAAQAASLSEDATDLAGDIVAGVEDEQLPQHAHQIRETLGVALILAERLAQDAGTEPMVHLEDQGDGTGQVTFTVELGPTDITTGDTR